MKEGTRKLEPYGSLVAYRPVEPSARVQISAPALNVTGLRVHEAGSDNGSRQATYRVNQGVFGYFRDVQSRLLGGFQYSFVDIQAR
jgi:hypothetical protein